MGEEEENSNGQIATITGLSTYDSPVDFANAIIAKAKDGEVNPLKTQIQIKWMESVCKSVNENEEYKRIVRQEAEKHGEKNFDYFGSSCKLQEVGSKYDFSECNHIEYNEIVEKFNRYNKRKKELEEFLKAMKKPTVINFDGCDEVVNPPKKTSTSSVVISFKQSKN